MITYVIAYHTHNEYGGTVERVMRVTSVDSEVAALEAVCEHDQAAWNLTIKEEVK